MEVLGIDIGGNSIKANIVDIATGALKAERFSIPTPHPADLAAIQTTLETIINHYDWSGPIGVGFPGVIRENVVKTAPNLDDSVIGLNLEDALLDLGAFEGSAINEADAAGIAEMKFGAGRNKKGTVLMATIGTGLGTALFYNSALVPNMEFGHAEFRGNEAESTLSERARIRLDLSWETWGTDLGAFLEYLRDLLSVDTIIIGGGGAHQSEHYKQYLTINCEYTFAHYGDEAGIIGAALAVDY
ncbi:MAG: ROK family protein [Opitutales bacterium]